MILEVKYHVITSPVRG